MAREKQGYRDALERIRHEAAGELVTVQGVVPQGVWPGER